VKINAFSQTIVQESVWPCYWSCKNHLYTSSLTLPFSTLIKNFLVQLPSSPAGTETHFKNNYTLISISDNVATPTPYSSASFFPHLPSFSLLRLFTLSFTVKTTLFILGAIIPKNLKKFSYAKLAHL